MTTVLQTFGLNLQIASFFCFYFLSKNSFEVVEIFKCLSLIFGLQDPINILPNIVNTLLIIQISNKRVFEFLSQSERKEEQATQQDYVICAEHAYFSYELEDSSICEQSHLESISVLKNISLNIQKGEKVGVVGRIGAGKSSILRAVNNSLSCLAGNLEVLESVALVSRSPWLFKGTIRENIVVNKLFEENFYSVKI